MLTCGQCKHGKLVTDNMAQRLCKGGPPQLILVPVTGQSPMPGEILGTGVRITNGYPRVLATDEACGAFAPRILDVANA